MEDDVKVDASAVIEAYRQRLAEITETNIILEVQVKALRLQLAATTDKDPKVE